MRKALYLLAFLPAMATAEVDPAMVEILDSCMKGPQDRTVAQDCIGVLTAQCVELPDRQTTVGMMQCAMSEAAAWDVLLNIEYQAARQFAEDMDARDADNFPEYAVRGDKLLAAQRAWITYRDANCASAYAVWGAGTMRQIMGADCHLQMTAERTIELHNYYGDMQ